MATKLRGAPKQRQKRESFIRLRPDESDSIPSRMARPESGGTHLRPDQIDRAQEIAGRLRDHFGSLAALERASTAADMRLKQQTMTVLLRNRQCGYRIAETLMAFAGTLPEFAGLPHNYILSGVGKAGTVSAPGYALRPMKYRAKGEFLDSLAGALPTEFLDFTAGRDPVEPDAASWQPVDWFAHVARELEFWKYLKAQQKPAKNGR